MLLVNAAAGERRGRDWERVVHIIAVGLRCFVRHMAALVQWGLKHLCERLVGFPPNVDRIMSRVDRAGAGQAPVRGVSGWVGNGCSIAANIRAAGRDATTLWCRMTGLMTVGAAGTGIAPWQYRGVCAADRFVW